MMAAVKNKNSRAELLLRRELWRRGRRYRLHDKGLIGRPDIVFAGRRVVVFVDSDFWHARTLVAKGEAALRATIRGTRQDWWNNKLARNEERDREVTNRLTNDGWSVVRVWESEVLADVSRVADRVERALGQRGPQHRGW
jgi:DNA mismatch endonuclease (patch repair protein)